MKEVEIAFGGDCVSAVDCACGSTDRRGAAVGAVDAVGSSVFHWSPP